MPKKLSQTAQVRLENDMLEPIGSFMEQAGIEVQAEGLRMLIRLGLGGQYDMLVLQQARLEGIRQGRGWIMGRLTAFLSSLNKELEAMKGQS